MATLSTKNIAYALYETTKDKKGKDLELAFTQAIEFLEKRHMLGKSKEILTELQHIIDEKEGIVRANIESATKLTGAMKEELEREIKHRYKAKEVHLDLVENKKLLGGVKVQVRDEIIDLTLSHQINQLQNHLIAH